VFQASSRPLDPATKIRALAERQLEELGIPKTFLPFLEGPEVSSGRFLFGAPAPDLDGDGSPEVLETDARYSYRVNEGPQQALPSVDSETDTRVVVRKGTNGKKLWTKRFDTDAWPISMRLGADGRPGVLVISGIWNFFGTTQQSTLTFDAFEGRRGKHLWSRSYDSVSYYDFLVHVTEDAPLIVATFDGLKGPAEDLMIGLATQVGGLFSSTTSTRVVVVDGASGAEIAHPAVDVGIDWWPIPLPTKDLDGDGLHDYATTNKFGIDLGQGQDPPAVGGTVYARRGTDGGSIWTTSGIDMELFGYTTALPDVVGDTTPEVALSTYVRRKADDLVPVPLPVSSPIGGFRYESRVYLFSGDLGQERWHRAQEWVYSPGDIDRDGKADVMLGNLRASFEKGRTALEQVAMQGDGSRLWQRRSVWRFDTMPCPRGLCSGGWGYYLDASSDLEPDGVDDLVFGQQVQQNQAFKDRITRVYDGRSGKMRFEEELPLQTVRVALDGRGADLLAYDHKQNQVRVSARNGNNRTLWEGSLISSEKILPRHFWLWGMGFALPGDRCGDLVITGGEEQESFYGVFDGGDGRLLWSRATAPKQQRLEWRRGRDSNPAC
jgi:hypothetical protein